MKTLFKIIIASILLIIPQVNSLFAEEKIKIGLIVPLSGEYKEIGESILKSVRLAVNKIDNSVIEIVPKDTKSNPEETLKVAKELASNNIKIIMGPVFNENVIYLDQIKEVTFLSFTNKIDSNPSNVISAGVNAISQLNTLKKFQNNEKIERTIFLIPNTNFKNEIEFAIKKTKIKLKDIFVYDVDPTILTSQIEKLTRYNIRKQNLLDEIKRVENSNDKNKDKKIENLKKRDTLGGINFDSVIIGDFDESLKSVTTSLLYTDVSSTRIKYMTLNQWFDPSLLKEKSLQPIYFPSINKENYEIFKKNYFETYKSIPNQISFLSYDLVGLIYYLIYKNNFKINEKIFLEKNKFKGKIGIFEISKNKITHQLNFYSVENGGFKKIF
tara:strand:+ start:4056 stop:5207 length:1152 start_codon:yes stop_codon:yes gene_type:complete